MSSDLTFITNEAGHSLRDRFRLDSRYNGALIVGQGTSKRDVRIQRFTWNADGSPNFGKPISPGVNLAAPSGEN